MSNGAYVAAARVAAALVITVALGVQAWADLTFGTFTWAQLPGFFTPLAALAGIAALLAAARAGVYESGWVAILRISATTYLVVVGVVYWALLAPFATPMFPWANAVLHGGAGAMLLIDWLYVGERRMVPLRQLWAVLIVPGIWLAYLWGRAFTDGWVPYPFLDPARGAGAIAATLTGFAIGGMAVAAALAWCARWSRRPAPPAPTQTPVARGPQGTTSRSPRLAALPHAPRPLTWSG